MQYFLLNLFIEAIYDDDGNINNWMNAHGKVKWIGNLKFYFTKEIFVGERKKIEAK